MKLLLLTQITAVLLQLLHLSRSQVDKAKKFLQKYNREIVIDIYENKQLTFLAFTNDTTHNEVLMLQSRNKLSARMKNFRKKASMINLNGTDDTTKRQFDFLLSSLNSKDAYVNENLYRIRRRMERAYQKTHVVHDSQHIKSIPKIQNETRKLRINDLMPIFHGERADPEEKLHVWKSFHDSLGPKVKDDYTEFVRLNNIVARENGFKDAGEYKRKMYEVEDLEQVAEEFWDELKPFYEELHAYVRYKMSLKLKDHFDVKKLMPAHLLGNIWGLTWDGIFDQIKPYPDEPSLDVDKGLKMKIKTPFGLFNMTEDFFTSIGWPKLPSTFWKKSMLQHPSDGRKVNCQPAAWDMMGEVEGEKDLRLAMCTELNHAYFITAHHEVGHLYYAMLYWDQPKEFREGANPAFHEAIGDTIALSVQIPQHLKKVGLLQNVSTSEEATINYLFKTAAGTVAFIPFAYIIDKWMWNVYNGNIKPHEYNKRWYELREKYQGVRAPIERKDDGFDIASKFHITADYPFIRYFFAVILQFTFHKYACKAANHTGPLHECSIYNSKEAGKALGDMLKLGRSKPWPEQLKQLTGSEKLSAEPLLEYFAPLRSWLKKQKKIHGYPVGWKIAERKPNAGRSSHASSLHMYYISLIISCLMGILFIERFSTTFLLLT